ncbi:MAG: DUF2752 domain-containing protein [Lachnospiraceae bacterium]|nr:DUF2752 domain-containing protein [Lachnospiraceae bacterium]
MMSIRIKNKEISITAVILIALILFLAFLGVYKCPFKLMFGIPCPSCGMTRALKSAITGNFKASFYYHPVWPLAVLTAITEVLYEFEIIKIDRKKANLIPIPLAIALVICYIIRMSMGLDI